MEQLTYKKNFKYKKAVPYFLASAMLLFYFVFAGCWMHLFYTSEGMSGRSISADELHLIQLRGTILWISERLASLFFLLAGVWDWLHRPERSVRTYLAGILRQSLIWVGGFFLIALVHISWLRQTDALINYLSPLFRLWGLAALGLLPVGEYVRRRRSVDAACKLNNLQ